MAGGGDWERTLERWLEPFLGRLGHPARRRMCPLYVAGLIGPGDRKSLQPMAARLGLPSHDALHHFVADGRWDATPLAAALMAQADRLVGGPEAVLIVDGEPTRRTRSRRRAPLRSASPRSTPRCWAKPPPAK